MKVTMQDQKRHILIVDDFKDNREMYDYFLSESGFRVTQASDGQEALAKANELQPDLVIMDLSLPGIDGWETARRLKAAEKTGRIPVVILTAYEFAGPLPPEFEGFLTKPCLPDQMISEINRILDRHQSEPDSPAGNRADAKTASR
jgi:two-component system, cell cycle response regulator DivK